MPFKNGGKVSPIYRTRTYSKARKALIDAFTPGQPCCLCGHPILHTRYIEAQHVPGTHTLLGLCHGTRHPCQVCKRKCNQVDGARRGRARQRTTPTPRRATTLRL